MTDIKRRRCLAYGLFAESICDEDESAPHGHVTARRFGNAACRPFCFCRFGLRSSLPRLGTDSDRCATRRKSFLSSKPIT